MEKKPFRSFSNLDFSFYVTGRFLVTLGIQTMSVVVSWKVYELTKDPLHLGMIGLTEAIPSIGVALFAGHFADTRNRKKIALGCISLLFFCSMVLAASCFYMTATHPNTLLTVIYLVVFLTGLARGVIGPAVFSMLPHLLRKEDDIHNAVSWNSSVWQFASIAGPASSGLLYYSVGPVKTLVLISVFIALAGYFFTRFSLPKPVHKEKVENIWGSLREGIRFVFGTQVVLAALSLDLFGVLFGGAVAILPLFVSEVLEVGPQGLGILRAAPGVGALITGLAAAYLPIRQHAGLKMLCGVAGFGFCMVAFALSTAFWVSVFILVVSGIFDGISVLVRQTLIQVHTPDEMKGRVSSVNNMFIGSSNEIGAFESGLAAKLMGLVPSVIFGGLMTLVVVVIVWMKAPKLRKMDL